MIWILTSRTNGINNRNLIKTHNNNSSTISTVHRHTIPCFARRTVAMVMKVLAAQTRSDRTVHRAVTITLSLDSQHEWVLVGALKHAHRMFLNWTKRCSPFNSNKNNNYTTQSIPVVKFPVARSICPIIRQNSIAVTRVVEAAAEGVIVYTRNRTPIIYALWLDWLKRYTRRKRTHIWLTNPTKQQSN